MVEVCDAVCELDGVVEGEEVRAGAELDVLGAHERLCDEQVGRGNGLPGRGEVLADPCLAEAEVVGEFQAFEVPLMGVPGGALGRVRGHEETDRLSWGISYLLEGFRFRSFRIYLLVARLYRVGGGMSKCGVVRQARHERGLRFPLLRIQRRGLQLSLRFMILSPPALARNISRSRHYRWWVFLALAIGTFTSVADFGSLNVTMPTIAGHFGTDLPTAQWVLIGYALAISALLLPMGRLSDIIGRKRVYVTGFVIFAVGGLFASTSDSILTLIAFKVLQGVGASMTQGTGMAMVLASFPSEERGKAIGSFITVVGSGNVAGPALGGFIAGTLGWQWVFYFGVILSLFAIASVLVGAGRTDILAAWERQRVVRLAGGCAVNGFAGYLPAGNDERASAGLAVPARDWRDLRSGGVRGIVHPVGAALRDRR